MVPKIIDDLRPPLYTVGTLPTKVLEKATDTILKGINDILEGIISR
jgi:hypothetical protein